MTNHRQRLFDRGRGFKHKEKYFVKHGTSDEYGNGCRHLFECFDPIKTKAQDTQRKEQAVWPRRARIEGPPWDAAVLYFFFGGELGSSLLFSVCASCSVLCVCLFSEIIDLSR